MIFSLECDALGVRNT